MNTRRLDAAQIGAIEEAAAILRQGEVVAFPTDTLYGVGCYPFNGAAINRLYAVKQRPAEKGIPILLADPADLDRVAAALPPVAAVLAERFWPGPLTLIVPKAAGLPEAISPNDNIAVRIPDHPVARAFIRAAGGSVATSSANTSGSRPARDAAEAYAALAGRIAAVLDGGHVQHGLPSTILDCTTSPPCLLRPGPVTPEELRAAGVDLP
jgi:L-threonylcarbamoyladenylate synthase